MTATATIDVRHPTVRVPASGQIASWLREGVADGASDWHFTPGEKPALRVYGDIRYLGDRPIAEEEALEAWRSLTKEEGREKRTFFSPDDRSVEIDLDGSRKRFRVHAKVGQTGFSFNLRSLADAPRPLTALGTPRALIELIHSRSAGLVLATGQTGSGKSTTLAAIIDHLVETQPIKVITYEAPIETIFRSRKGLVQQHEVGPYGHGHIENFIEAAKSAMREDPDVIMFGELREPEAIRYAVEAAETGHLVFGTLHTGNAEQSISRLITASPGEGKEFFLNSISTALLGVVSQRLIPTREGKLRANYELMIVNEGISGCIARADFNQIKNTMLTGRRDGMFTFEEHLEELFLSKEYSAEEVVRFSPVPRAMLRHLHNRKHITSQQFQLIGRMYGIQNI